MESSTASKPSKIKRFGRSIRNHARQARDAMLSSSRAPSLRSPSPHPSSTAVSGLQGPDNVTSEPSSQHAVAAPPGTSLPEKYKEGLNVAWHGLETALRVLGKSADAFPPLKSAVGGLVACLDVVQVSHSRLFKLLCPERFHRQPQAIEKTIKT